MIIYKKKFMNLKKKKRKIKNNIFHFKKIFKEILIIKIKNYNYQNKSMLIYYNFMIN